MSMMVIGLIANWAGVIVLFLFGMPFHVPTKGVTYLDLGIKNDADIRKERWFGLLGWLGLALITVGTILQILATLGIL